MQTHETAKVIRRFNQAFREHNPELRAIFRWGVA
jgi:hypothetical protein